MKGLKRGISIVLAIILMFGLAGCGGTGTPPSNNTPAQNANPAPSTSPDPNAAPSGESSYYAGKTVTLIVPWAAGGSVDVSARIIAQYAEKYLGGTIVVENMTGGSGSVAYTEVLNRPHDGLTLAMGASPMMTHPYLIEGATYSFDSFEPIIMTTKEPNMIVVKSDGKWGDMDALEFLTYAKEHPGEVIMGVGGHWASHDVARAALELQSGIRFKKVAVDGGAEVVANVLGGHVDCGFNYYAEFKAQVDSGELKVLCCTGDARHPYLPDVPTLGELAKEFGETWDLDTIGSWKGVLMPKGAPQEAIDELRAACEQAVEDPEFLAAMDAAGLPVIVLKAQEFHDMMVIDDSKTKAIAEQLIAEGKN